MGDGAAGAVGGRLFGIVCEYSDIAQSGRSGHHRSGTASGRATEQWFAELFRDLGEVSTQQIETERCEVDSRLTADGQAVEHLALYYEFAGSIDTSNVAVRLFDTNFGGYPDVADALIAETAQAGYEALVIATKHPHGELVAINRELQGHSQSHGSGLPTVLVAGREYERLRHSRLRLQLSARTSPAVTQNISISNAGCNTSHGPRLILTTPIHGWFTCAGERGTGIAVLRRLAELLARYPITVLGTGGHEVGYVGAYRWVDNYMHLKNMHLEAEADLSEPIACIAHLGASIAVEARPGAGMPRSLIGTRVAMTNLDTNTAQPIAAALKAANLPLRCNVESWMGEGEAFEQLGVPMLSTTGAGIDFHTPSDTPDRVTSPAALATVADSTHDAVRELIRAASSSSSTQCR